MNSYEMESPVPEYPTALKSAQKVDAPALILQSILDNKTVVKELVTNGPGKTAILERAIQKINPLDEQEKIIFLEEIFVILSDPYASPDQRDAVLELLRTMDLTNVSQEGLRKTYVQEVSNLREGLIQDSDQYGTIYMLLEAGKTIAPFIENSQYITQAWKRVAKAFTEDDRQKILDDAEEIRQLIPNTFSEFDTKVLMLAEEGLRSREIAKQLKVPIKDVQRSKERLNDKGIEFRSLIYQKGDSNDTAKLPNLS